MIGLYLKKHCLKFLVRTSSLKLVLILPFLLQITITVGIIGYLSLKNGEKTVSNISDKLLFEITFRVRQKLSSYTSSAILINKLNAKAIRDNQIDLNEPKVLLKHFSNQLENFQHISMTYWGNESGDFYGARFYEDGTIVSDFSNQKK